MDKNKLPPGKKYLRKCKTTYAGKEAKLKFKGEIGMSVIDVEKSPVHECPNCGGVTIRIRQRISGIGEYYVDLKSGDIEASELHSNLIYKNTGKYAVCADCGKRLFKIDDNLNIL